EIYDPYEYFWLGLSGATNTTINDYWGQGSITDDDTPVYFSVNDVSVTEGNSGTTGATFTVTLDRAVNFPTTVYWFTNDGTALAGSDYTGVTVAQPLNFAPGETSKTLTVSVLGDTSPEANETFSVRLQGSVNAYVSDNTGVGTIVNDDFAALSVSDVT